MTSETLQTSSSSFPASEASQKDSTPAQTTQTAQKQGPVKSKDDLTYKAPFLERNFYFSSKHELFNCFGVSIVVNKPISREQFYVALRKIILKYPKSITSVYDEFDREHHLRFIPKTKIIFDDNAVEFNEKFDQYPYQNKELSALLTSYRFDADPNNGKPSWKIVYFPKIKMLSWLFDHPISDGASGAAFCKELVESLNYITQKELDEAKDLFESSAANKKAVELFNLEKDISKFENPITPDSFKIAGYKPSLAEKIGTPILRFFLDKFPKLFPLVIEGEMHKQQFVDTKTIKFDNKKFFVREQDVISKDSPLCGQALTYIRIDPETTAKILQQCRNNNTKFQTTFMMVFLSTIHEIAPEAYTNKYLKIVTAANFRHIFPNYKYGHSKFLSKPDSYTKETGQFKDGFHDHAVVFYVEPFKKFNWNLVQKYHNFLHKLIRSKQWFSGYYLASEAVSAKTFFDQKIGTHDDTYFALTNLGFVDLIDHGEEASNKYQIEDLIFTASPGPMTGTHSAVLTSTKNGINICVADQDPAINSEEFRARLTENLRKLAESGNV